MALGLHVVEARRPHLGGQRSRQGWVCEVLVPTQEHALVQLGIGGVQRERRPVDVPEHHPAAGPQRAVDLGQRPRHVVHVLQHLNAQRGVRARVAHRQVGGVALEEHGCSLALAAARRHGKHVRAGVDARDRSAGPDLLQQLGRIEPRATADVENVLARLGRQRVADQAPAAQGVANSVHRLEPLDHLRVEVQLGHGGHGRTLSSRGVRRPPRRPRPRDPRPDQALRRRHAGRRGLRPHRARRRVLRPARAQRRGQDHRDQRHLQPDPGHRRRGARCSASRPRRCWRAAGSGWPSRTSTSTASSPCARRWSTTAATSA